MIINNDDTNHSLSPFFNGDIKQNDFEINHSNEAVFFKKKMGDRRIGLEKMILTYKNLYAGNTNYSIPDYIFFISLDKVFHSH